MFTLASSAIGAGVLSLPLVLKNTGVVLGIILLLVGAALALFSIKIMVECANETNQTSYSGLVDHVFGARAASLLEVVLVVYCFGACVAYFIVISQCLQAFLSLLIPEQAALQPSLFTDSTFWLVLATALIIFPLSLMRNLSGLRYGSIASVASMLYVAIAVVLRGFSGSNPVSLDHVALARVDGSIFSSITITFFAYTCHVNVFPIYSELKNRQPRRMFKVTNRSVALEVVLYIFVALFGYLCFHDDTQGNILNNYAPSDPYMLIGRLAVATTLVVALPLNIHPCRQNLSSVLFPNKEFSQARHVFLTVVLVFSALTLAIIVPQVNVVFGLLGATCCVLICFAIPIISYVNIFGEKMTSFSVVVLYTLLAAIVFVGACSVADSLRGSIRA